MEEIASNSARILKFHIINKYYTGILSESSNNTFKNSTFEPEFEDISISNTTIEQVLNEQTENLITNDLNSNKNNNTTLYKNQLNSDKSHCQIKHNNDYSIDGSKNNSIKHYQHFIAGALAGAVSRTLTAPLERLKILYQVNYRCSTIQPPKITKGLRELYFTDGITGLFRGNLINVTKATPDTAIKLYVFEKVKFYMKSVREEKLSIDKLFLAGAVAGVTASFCVFPLDVIKTRLSAAPSGTYSGIFDTVKKLYNEGGLRIFYKGVEASICSAMPNSGLNLCCYELLKRFFSGSHASDNAVYLSTATLMMIGGLSALISSSLLYPLQTVQSRLIMQGLAKSDMHMIRFNSPFFYIGDNLIIKKKQTMIQVIKSTFQKEGVRGFYKGYCPGMTKIIIGNAISFGSYEKFKNLLKY